MHQQDRELESIKLENKNLAATLSERNSDNQKLTYELQNLQLELNTVKTQSLSVNHNHNHDQGQAEQQARMLESLSQAYLYVKSLAWILLIVRIYNQLEELVHKKDDEIAALTKQIGQTSG